MSLFECLVTQGFGWNLNDSYKNSGLKGHPATDEVCGYGSDVHDVFPGKVYSMFTPEKPALDGYTCVYQICGNSLETFEFSTGHLSEITCKTGDELKKGNLIGKEGNKGTVYFGGERITLDMQKAGDKRGSHRHRQFRPVRRVLKTNPAKMYLQTALGLYRDEAGYYYEIYDYYNGYAGCIDFTKPMFTRDLFIGCSGYDVYLLQKAIGAEEKYQTGFFGWITFNKLREYQGKLGILKTGYFGPITRGRANGLHPRV